ncbi:MAG: hypothetical protein H5U37_07155 [Caldisericia bacterium]|nr:hypothetical protein [Caldisericia bacterium]
MIIIPIIKSKILGNINIYFYDSFFLPIFTLKLIYERFTVPIEYINLYPSLIKCYLSILGNIIFGIVLILLTNYLKIRYEENI